MERGEQRKCLKFERMQRKTKHQKKNDHTRHCVVVLQSLLQLLMYSSSPDITISIWCAPCFGLALAPVRTDFDASKLKILIRSSFAFTRSFDALKEKGDETRRGGARGGCAREESEQQ